MEAHAFTVIDNTVICPVFQVIAANPLKIAPKTATVKYSKLKKKNKKMKKGTYKVTVKAKALGNTNYKASAWKTVTFKVRVK